MSIPTDMSKREFQKLAKELRRSEVIVAFDKQAHIKLLLVGIELVKQGWKVAKITKGYQE